MYGANLVHGLAPFDAQRNLRVVIETPRGSNVKIKYDEELGCFSLSRVLPLGAVPLVLFLALALLAAAPALAAPAPPDSTGAPTASVWPSSAA